MRRTVRFPIAAVTVVVTLLSIAAGAASAQGVSQVQAGSDVAVANNGECRPNTDVALYFEGGGVDQVQVGAATSDAAGSFEATVAIPADAAEGAAAILVDCGLDSAVLTYDLEVVGAGFSLGSLAGPVLVGLAVIAIIGLIAVLRRRRMHGDDTDGTDDAGTADQPLVADDDEVLPVRAGTAPIAMGAPEIAAGAAPGSPVLGTDVDAAAVQPSTPPIVAGPSTPEAPPVPVPAASASADAAHDDDHHDDGGIDDGADYWFWEAATSAGPRRRVACMTETTFHLHEVSVEAFQSMLDHLVEVGPDAALAGAFVRIPIAAVDRVVRDGTVVHIEGRGANGPHRQTIDLAEGADGVVEMLGRRVTVVDAHRVEEPVR